MRADWQIFEQKGQNIRFFVARPEVDIDFWFRRLVLIVGLYTREFFHENPPSRFRDIRGKFSIFFPFTHFVLGRFWIQNGSTQGATGG